MITMQEWKAMSGLEQTLWLEDNFKVNGIGRPRSLVYGFGVNDAPYCTQPRMEGKQVRCQAYIAWQGMLMRACSQMFHANNPTYSGVTICEDWHSFMSFRRWWIENQVDSWQLDKDILSDSREYSPETSIFVPQWLNKFTLGRDASRGDCPIGVHYCKRDRAFQSYCSHPFRSGRDNLGYFSDQNSAHAAWLRRKLDIALELKPLMDEIDVRIYDGVTKIIKSMR